MGYLSSWETGSHSFSPISLIKSELTIKAFLILFIFFILWWKKKNINRNLIFVFIWFSFSFFGATLSGRPYAHYLIQVLPSFCLLIGWIFFEKRKTEILFPIAAVFIFGYSFFHYRFWIYPIFSYYRNFASLVLGLKNKNDYYSFFNPSLPKIYETAEFIAANSSENNRIFVWADEPSFYPLSQRLPATPNVVAYHILDLKKISQTIKSLYEKPPEIIILQKNIKDFPGFDKFLNNNYLKLETIGDFKIFRQRILLTK
jgi:hypothetical protein